jgi:signal transduction histidine kinase
MNQTVQQLSSYDSEQKTFFQNVSHELRTPLMSIKLHAEGIEHGVMEQVKSSRIIIDEVDRLSEMVEDLLYISRMHSLPQEIEMQKNDLRETLSRCAQNLKSVADQKGIQYIFAFSDQPVLFTYNEKHMYRALYNLIDNALGYAKSRVALTCRIEDGKILVAVEDDGEGIATDVLPHIFKRFYKGPQGKQGIGLSIVKSIIEMHHGGITVDCDELTRFRIVFEGR